MAGRNAYAFVLSECAPAVLHRENRFAFDAGITAAPETFWHWNLESSEEYSEENYSWNHGYEERQSLVSIPLEFWFFDSLYMISDLEFKEEHNTVDSGLDEEGIFPSWILTNHFNILFDDPDPKLDLYFPYRALLSVGGANWNLRFGRDQLNWGNGNSGNLMLSDYSDYYDFLLFSLWARDFKMTNVYAVMDPYLADGTSEHYKAFLGHRFDIRMWKRALLSISESYCFSGSAYPDLVHDLNFLMVFHNWLLSGANSLMTVELSVNPWKYLNVYGQIAMDEFMVQYEADRGGGGGPPIFAYMAGAESTIPVGPGYLGICAEWVLTSPWIYNRKSAPYYYQVRHYWSLTTDKYENIVKPIGYEYGPDSIVWYAEASYTIPASFSLAFDCTYLIQGENTITSDWDPAEGDVAPTGTAEKSIILHLGAEYPFLSWLSVGCDLYYESVVNLSHIEGAFSKDLEAAAYIMFSF